MTVVDAWNLWPLWRWLVWAALGMSALAFAVPSQSSQPQTVVALPPLPPPSYQPPPAFQPAAPSALSPPPIVKRPRSVPPVPMAVEAEAPQPVRPIITPEGLPQAAPERKPGTYSSDPRALKPRPLVTP